MNIYTHEIAKMFNVSLDVALKIQTEMECNAFDFSEATDNQFKREAKLAQKAIMA